MGRLNLKCSTAATRRLPAAVLQQLLPKLSTARLQRRRFPQCVRILLIHRRIVLCAWNRMIISGQRTAARNGMQFYPAGNRRCARCRIAVSVRRSQQSRPLISQPSVLQQVETWRRMQLLFTSVRKFFRRRDFRRRRRHDVYVDFVGSFFVIISGEEVTPGSLLLVSWSISEVLKESSLLRLSSDNQLDSSEDNVSASLGSRSVLSQNLPLLHRTAQTC